jgi:hypothetical protein
MPRFEGILGEENEDGSEADDRPSRVTPAQQTASEKVSEVEGKLVHPAQDVRHLVGARPQGPQGPLYVQLHINGNPVEQFRRATPQEERLMTEQGREARQMQRWPGDRPLGQVDAEKPQEVPFYKNPLVWIAALAVGFGGWQWARANGYLAPGTQKEEVEEGEEAGED